MGLAEAIVAVVADIADGRPVVRVRVRVGSQHAVVTDSLGFSFQLASEGTNAGGALLEVVPVMGETFSVDEIEVGGDSPEVIVRPDLEVTEAAHGDEHDVHRHPAWL